MASTVSGMGVVCHKEGTGLGKLDAHDCIGVHQHDEYGLHQDYEKWLELAPHTPTSQYLHNRTGEDNADAHLERQVRGREVVVAVTGSRLNLGTWERIF
jgi:thiamine phosphate synthase YjbQ (UPF0047 family)